MVVPLGFRGFANASRQRKYKRPYVDFWKKHGVELRRSAFCRSMEEADGLARALNQL